MDYKIRCSGLSRVMNCSGSVGFKDLFKPESGEAAKEGTACGELLERKLTSQPIGTHAENGVPFDSDMEYYTNGIFDDILAKSNGEVLCETRIDWMTRAGIPVKGKYDASFVVGSTLYVDDLKYGWRIVEVKENWQLLGYAIGEVIRRGQVFDKIVLRIHQPRPHHEDGPTREWVISYEELLEYKEQIEMRMESLVRDELLLNTGSHCRYCPAAATACTAMSKSFYRGVEVIEDFHQDDMTPEEMSHQLQLLDRVSEVMKIKKDSLEALIIDRISNGVLVPNYVTKQKFGDRKWKSSISPDAIKMITGKDVTEQIMLSPAKVQKLGLPKKLIDSMTERHFAGNKLTYCDTSKVGDEIFGNPNESK